MRRLVLQSLSELRGAYWFWPSVMTLAALALGLAMPALDGWLGTEWMRDVSLLRPTQVDGARAILTTLAGAALGVAGVAFSITMVAVSFATANYGPRLIGNFMSDRANQVVLGILVATFVYCVTVLAAVDGRIDAMTDGGEALTSFVPQVSLMLALALMLASVGALIFYIHHIPESIDIMKLAARIGRALRARLEALVEEAERAGHGDTSDDAGRTTGTGTQAVLRATESGYLRWIDHTVLARVARDEGARIRVLLPTGAFVVEGDALIGVRWAAGAPVDGPTDALDALAEAYALGSARSDEQDVLLLSDQLVEVAVRALSPGVNDPHTAVLCLDWLRAGLQGLVRRPPLPEVASAEQGSVTWPGITFAMLLDRCFDRMRSHIAADRTAALHALDVLAALMAAAERESAAARCASQMRLLGRAAADALADAPAREEVAAALTRALATAPSEAAAAE
jgi:uncharacterized membrane protein